VIADRPQRRARDRSRGPSLVAEHLTGPSFTQLSRPHRHGRAFRHLTHRAGAGEEAMSASQEPVQQQSGQVKIAIQPFNSPELLNFFILGFFQDCAPVLRLQYRSSLD
jgi:hypothetical protein